MAAAIAVGDHQTEFIRFLLTIFTHICVDIHRMNKSNNNEYDELTKRIGFTSMMELICICLFPLILQCLRSLSIFKQDGSLIQEHYTI
ncbi:unnamed protein product [Schistosoma curassoni]|nr:unnamed protein product [Schistosoma curassoni]